MPDDSPIISMAGHHDLGLVGLSIFIAVWASYAALDLAGQVTRSEGRIRMAWLWGGAAAMGAGIWSMHFVAMLAFRLPIPVNYSVPIVVLSVAPAVLASALALALVSRETLGSRALLGGGLLMGAGIGAMHYTGMAAMRLDARVTYDPLLFSLSVVIAVVVSLVALWLAFVLRSDIGPTATLQRLVAALVMGAGIAGLHYTATAAAHFAPYDATRVIGELVSAPGWLARAIGVSTAFLLGLVLAGSVVARRRRVSTGPIAAAPGAGR